MDKKKQILKSACGKGGKTSTPFKIVRDMVVKGGGSLIKDIKDVAYNTFVAPSERVREYNKKKNEEQWRKHKDKMEGREEYKPEVANLKKQLLKRIVRKNSAGEIINPTKRDVSEFNKKFDTIKPLGGRKLPPLPNKSLPKGMPKRDTEMLPKRVPVENQTMNLIPSRTNKAKSMREKPRLI